MIPSGVTIPPGDSGKATINQMKGNNAVDAGFGAAGYTGGLRVNTSDEFVWFIEGGERIDNDNYSSELERTIGTCVRDQWHKIGYHVLWSKTAGWAIMYLDDVKVDVIFGAPTMAEESSVVMFRCGWYPATIPSSGLDLRVRNIKIYA
jgi:hypothetical protein